jgi:hypothetical protein
VGSLGVGVGLAGLIRPASVSWFYSAWMIAAFPIGWTITQIVLVLLFYGLFTPIALFFRWFGRDELALKRSARPTYWISKPQSSRVDEYLREY